MTQVHGWGRYPRIEGEVVTPTGVSRIAAAIETETSIARGLGRSYGDSSLAARMISTQQLDHFISFDAASGIVECEAGTSLDEILRLAVPAGWFLPVTPGTRYVSIGGAIASDVHGKNHHVDGTFGMHVLDMEIVTGRGERVRVSAQSNADLFRATCGGMGLTGVIASARLQLQRIAGSAIRETTIKAKNFDALIDAFEANTGAHYSVAWIDAMATGSALGRGLLMLGEHSAGGPLDSATRASRQVPFEMPDALLSSVTARAFNALYYGRVTQTRSERTVPFTQFFYPLDGLMHWNRLYGKGGFVQYQFVLPLAAGREALREILTLIATSGQASYLGVLKKFGTANGNMLSFPIEGYTLALDFKAQPVVFELLDRLDERVLSYGGRLYLAKDARMSETTFKRAYPRWQEFEDVRARWHAHGHFASAQSKRLGLQ